MIILIRYKFLCCLDIAVMIRQQTLMHSRAPRPYFVSQCRSRRWYDGWNNFFNIFNHIFRVRRIFFICGGGDCCSYRCVGGRFALIFLTLKCAKRINHICITYATSTITAQARHCVGKCAYLVQI